MTDWQPRRQHQRDKSRKWVLLAMVMWLNAALQPWAMALASPAPGSFAGTEPAQAHHSIGQISAHADSHTETLHEYTACVHYSSLCNCEPSEYLEFCQAGSPSGAPSPDVRKADDLPLDAPLLPSGSGQQYVNRTGQTEGPCSHVGSLTVDPPYRILHCAFLI